MQRLTAVFSSPWRAEEVDRGLFQLSLAAKAPSRLFEKFAEPCRFPDQPFLVIVGRERVLSIEFGQRLLHRLRSRSLHCYIAVRDLIYRATNDSSCVKASGDWRSISFRNSSVFRRWQINTRPRTSR